MREEQDGLILVRAELYERLARLQGLSRRSRSPDYARSVAAFRGLAASYGFGTVARLVEAVERIIAEENSARLIPLYLDRLYDAIGCGRADEQTSEAMIASVAVRFGA